jgi:hypothetical protein
VFPSAAGAGIPGSGFCPCKTPPIKVQTAKIRKYGFFVRNLTPTIKRLAADTRQEAAKIKKGCAITDFQICH